MTLNGAIMKLVELSEHPMMPVIFKPAIQKVIETISELEEKPEPHWIPVTERLPEEPFGCLVTVMDTNPMTMEEFENILPYFVGWDGERWNDDDGEQCPFEVLAWCELPEPYKGVTT